MTLLKCNYLIFTNLFFCYFHSFCYDSKHLRKKLHLFTLFSITRHCFSLFLVGSKSMLALLPFKVTITPRHWNDKCFHRAGGDLICRFCICASHFQHLLVRNKKSCAWQYVPPGWFEECDHGVPECQFLYDSDTVKSSKLKNVRRKLNILLLRRHLYTIQCHMTTLWYRSWHFWQVLTDRACRQEPDFSQPLEDGSDSTCGRRVHAVQNKTPEQTSACFACKYGPP